MEKKNKGYWEVDVDNSIVLEFDKDYVDIEIVDYVEKTGEGENDFVIKKKVVETRRPIAEVVNADAESVGVYNIIKQVLRTGDTSLLPADDGKCNVDFVGAPENLMELKQMGVDAEKKFASLPDDLKGDLDMTTFVNSMTQEKFDQFLSAIAARAAGNKGENKDE